ncbi:MAG: hypothetical protein NTY60_01125 [Proteobacteria bacterium]|nr:hypothetical protein [Pseudomonadota bacterium]
MKKNTSNKMNLARKTQVAIAVAMLTGPILAVPEIVYAAETVHLYLKANAADIKGSEKYTIVGLQDAHTVYKSAGGQFFYLNKQGDMQFLTEGIFKFFRPNPKGDGTTEEESHDHKHPGDISILGVDANGHTINQNERGEKFFVNTGSGDFTFVDGKNLTPFHAPAPDSNPANLTIRKAGDKPVEYLNVGKAPVTPGTATPLAWSWGMSQQGTLAWSWGGTQSETRSKENPHLPKAGDTVLFEGKQGVVRLQNGSPVINWGDGTTSSGSKGGAGKALSSFFDVFTERSVGKGGNANAGGITHEDTWDANKSLPVPDSGPPSKHHYIGTVTLLKGMAPNPKDGQSSGPANLSLNFAKIEVEYHETENKAGSGNYKVGSKLGTDGSFHFNLPEGKYKLQLPGQPEQSVIVGSDGKFGGKVMEGSDGKMLIFDRWGKRPVCKQVGGAGVVKCTCRTLSLQNIRLIRACRRTRVVL